MISSYLFEVKRIIDSLDQAEIAKVIDILKNLKGRLFILGNGGSAANASHAVNDFRKIAGMEAYCPSDNVAELTAWTNDEGWKYTYHHWLMGSHINKNDAVLVLSVGGGSPKTSHNIVEALKLANAVEAKILGIVGRDGGYTAKVAHACVFIPTVNIDHVTPHVESFQAILCHLIVNAL